MVDMKRKLGSLRLAYQSRSRDRDSGRGKDKGKDSYINNLYHSTDQIQGWENCKEAQC